MMQFYKFMSLHILLYTILSIQGASAVSISTKDIIKPNINEIKRQIDGAKPGDTVFIPGGLYKVAEPLLISTSGTRNAWIIITAEPGEVVVFDGSSYLESFTPTEKQKRPPNTGVLMVSNAHYVRISNITVKQSHNVGILLLGPSTTNIELNNCKVEGSYNSGIGVWYVDSCKLIANEVIGANNQALRPKGVALGREAPHEAITLAGATHFEVTQNKVHDCFKEGIDVKEVSAYGEVHHNTVYNMPRQGLYVDCWFGRLHNIEFHHNITYNCEWGFAISAEGKDSSMDSIYFHHNTLYNNEGSGIKFGVWGEDQRREHIYIYNNTIFNNGSKNHWAGLTGGIDIRSANIEHVFIYNNIVAANYGFAIGFSVPPTGLSAALKAKNITITNNLEWQTGYPQGEKHKGIFKVMYPIEGNNALKEKPAFNNVQSGDFSFPKTSQAAKWGWHNAPKGNANYLGAVPIE